MTPDLPAPASLPPGLRVYAIGDVHGCARRLAELHAAIAEDAAARPAQRTAVVHLGDYVDRGPDSAGALDLLLRGSPVPGAEHILLRGNHEEMMLAALAERRGGSTAALWLANGGLAALDSYGATEDPETWSQVPDAHRALLRSMPLTWRAGGYLFVHAGLRPMIPFERQDPVDLVWIREPFLSFLGDLGAVVVHGHTPAEAPVVRNNRIGIDTGAVYGGYLTCLILEEDRLGFLAA